MSGIANSILDTIGNTPVVRLSRFGAGVQPSLHVKIESMNPGGSMKDRAARRMIEKAEKDHGLKPGAKIIIATSGNMGVGMAMVCAVKKFQLFCLVDPKISPATEKCLELYGAKLIKVFKRDKTGGYHLTRLEMVDVLKKKHTDLVIVATKLHLSPPPEARYPECFMLLMFVIPFAAYQVVSSTLHAAIFVSHARLRNSTSTHLTCSGHSGLHASKMMTHAR